MVWFTFGVIWIMMVIVMPVETVTLTVVGIAAWLVLSLLWGWMSDREGGGRS